MEDFPFAKHPRDITLLDIVSSTESTIKISYCLEQNTEESKRRISNGSFHVQFFIVIYRTKSEERLSHKTLEQLLSES